MKRMFFLALLTILGLSIFTGYTECSVSYIEIHFIISDQFLSRTNESSGYRRVGRRLPGREDMTVGTLTWKRKVQDDFSEDSGLM